MMLAQKGGVDDIERLEARGYTFDLKVDGVRCLAEVEGGAVRLTSRSGVDMTTRYPEITEALAKAHPDVHIVLDGEVAVDDEKGMPSWPLTHKRDAQQSRAHWWSEKLPATFHAFDLLQLGPRDMRRWEFTARRKALVDLGKRSWKKQRRVKVVLHSTVGTAIWIVVEVHKLEGVVAKNPRAPYREGKRSSDWLKIKRTQTVSCAVGGFDPGEGGRASTFGALHLYLLNEHELVPVGKVGSGFSDKELAKVRAQLDTDVPFVVEVSYLDVSPDGKLRQPVFQRVREDLGVTDATVDQLSSQEVSS